MSMRAVRKESRHVAAEFAALVLERAKMRGDLNVYLREMYGVDASHTAFRADVERQELDKLIGDLWHKSQRFPPSLAKENIHHMSKAIEIFEEVIKG